MKRKILLLVAVLVLFSGCSQVENQLSTVTLMLDYTPNTNHSGIIVAQSLGYYEEEGIDLQILQPAEVSVPTAVATNQVDLGVSYQEDVLMANQQDMNLMTIYGILNHNTSGLMSFKDKGIETPKDLENKTYCGWGSDLEKSLIDSLMKENDADPNLLTRINATTSFLNSDPNECDVFWEFEAWAGIEAQSNGIDYNYIAFNDYGFDEYTPVIITSQEYLENNKYIIQSFINATIRGYEYAYNNPEETAIIFTEEYPEYDLDFIMQSQYYINEYYINDENNKFGYISDSIWENFKNYLISENIIENDNNKGYTNEFIDNYYQSNN